MGQEQHIQGKAMIHKQDQKSIMKQANKNQAATLGPVNLGVAFTPKVATTSQNLLLILKLLHFINPIE